MNKLAAHLGRGEHAEVLHYAELALHSRPDDTGVLMLMANSLDHLGQHEQAANVRHRILELDPDDLDSLFLLGRYHEQSAEERLACKFYEQVLNSNVRKYPLGESDFGFMRAIARLLGSSPEVIERSARRAERRLDQEAAARREHAKTYLATHQANGGHSDDA